jgi:hypothetical protein
MLHLGSLGEKELRRAMEDNGMFVPQDYFTPIPSWRDSGSIPAQQDSSGKLMSLGQFTAAFQEIEDSLPKLLEAREKANQVRRSMVDQCRRFHHLFIAGDEQARDNFTITMLKSIRQEYHGMDQSVLCYIARDFVTRPNWTSGGGNYYDRPYKPNV